LRVKLGGKALYKGGGMSAGREMPPTVSWMVAMLLMKFALKGLFR
jgi:hypothetical protein